ncbi:hypothetical protein [Fibrobacter sp. UWS1]|uniref:hypothetical protein n=1 Tax=Fibrobacter sp. UWS1 TaxID=1896220 RepID=UPI000BB0FFCF|nr:hypothetical protein [Fibrobacter sp. UWS1]
MMDCVYWIGAFFWLPLFLWLALFLWARFLAYPLFLKYQIRRGKTWCYIPGWWLKNAALRIMVRFVLLLLCVLAALSSSATLYWLYPVSAYWFVFLFLGVLILARPVVNFSMRFVYRLELDAYFLEYRKQSEFYDKAGHPLSDYDLAGHAAWAFRDAMHKADAEKRFFKYLKEMSNQAFALEKGSLPC